MQFDRIALTYHNQHQVVHDTDALGIYDFQISVQGKPFRQPHSDEDLFGARTWLQTSGFHPISTDKKKRGYRGNGFESTFVEYWALKPIPAQPAGPTYSACSYIYNRATKQWEVVDALGELIRAYKYKYEAQWHLLSIDAPNIHRALKTLYAPYLGHLNRADITHRVLRAGQLLATWNVTHRHNQPHTFHVDSQSTSGLTYQVVIPHAPQPWTCTVLSTGDPCPDQSAPDLGNGPRCKHKIAAWTLLQAGDHILPPAPVLPFPREQKKAASAATETAQVAIAPTTTAQHHTTPHPIAQPA